MKKPASQLDAHNTETTHHNHQEKPKLRLRTYNTAGWDDIYEEFLGHVAASYEAKTLALYRTHLGGVVRWMKSKGVPFSEFSARDLDRFLSWRKEQPTKRRPKEMPAELVEFIENGQWVRGSLDFWASRLNVQTSTVKRYRATIERSLTSKPQAKAAPKTVTDSTRRKDALCARMFTRFCYQRGIIDRDPLKDYAVPSDNRTIPVTPTEADLRHLLDTIARMYDPAKNPKIKGFRPKTRAFFRTRNLAVIVGLAQTGARLGEMLSLTMSDYDASALEVTFRNTKTDIDRQVPITTAWADIVGEYLKHRPRAAASANLFVNEFGESITVDAWEKTFRRLRDFANECRKCFGTGKSQTSADGRPVVLSGRGWDRLPKEACPECGGTGNVTDPVVRWSMHGTRHYAITKLCDRAGIDKAQAIAGHQNIVTTQRYNHIAKDRLRAAMADADLLPMDKPVMVNKRSAANRKRRLV